MKTFLFPIDVHYQRNCFHELHQLALGDLARCQKDFFEAHEPLKNLMYSETIGSWNNWFSSLKKYSPFKI